MAENTRDIWFKWLILLLIVIIVLAILTSLLGSGSGMMGGGMMGGMMGFGWLFMLIPIIFIIIIIYALTDRDSHEYSQPPYYRGESPIEALERRYASGEISRGEYLRINEDINKR